MKVQCSSCPFQGDVDPSKIPPQGARVKCPRCGEPFVIRPQAEPSLASEPVAQPEPLVPAADPPVHQGHSGPGADGFRFDPGPTASRAADPTPAPDPAGDGLSLAGPPLDREMPPAGETGLSLRTPPPASAPAAPPPGTTPPAGPATGTGLHSTAPSVQPSSARSSISTSGTGRRPRDDEKGGLMPRLAARLLDGAVFLLFFFLVVKPIYFKMSFDAFEKFAASPEMTQFLNSQEPNLPDMTELGGSMVSAVAVAQALIWGFLLLYNVFFLGRYGATPGKMMVGLRVNGPGDGDLGYFRAFGRFLADFILVPFTLGLGYLLALFNQDGKGLHDLVAGTRVVQA